VQARRILLIEDNPDHALVASRVLERAGFSVTTVITGQAGIESVSNGFDLVLLDYGLPDMDGMQVLTAISRANVPVVFVTGRSDAKLAVDALRAGAANYIVKDSHYVSKLPEVARETLEQSPGRFSNQVARVRLESDEESAEEELSGLLLRLLPAEAMPVRYASGDYLVFCRDASALAKLDALSRELSVPVSVRHWRLDHASSLRELIRDL
jgi:DNA-binding response OmpR family regulator